MLQGKVAVLLLVAIAIFSSMAAFNFLKPFSGATGMFLGFGEPRAEAWWNTSWTYRQCIEINSTGANHTEWPVEIGLNFSDMMPSGSFDENSIRVIEYLSDDETNQVVHQFIKEVGYNAQNNAIGTLLLMLNGTLEENQARKFCVYYDDNSTSKNATGYSNMTYSHEGDIINVNTTALRFYIDEMRGENLSGISFVQRVSDDMTILQALDDERPAEYLEYYNGSDNLSFELDSIVIMEGPLAVAIRMNGTEAVINGSSTGRAYIEKTYYIYNNSGPGQKGAFFKLRQKIRNINGAAINISSPGAGAPALDLDRTFPASIYHPLTYVNTTNPFSYAKAASEFENFFAAIINMNQTGTSNFYADNETYTYGRIGIRLTETELQDGEEISQNSLIYLGAFDDPGTEFNKILLAAKSPENITLGGIEKLKAPSIQYVNSTVYNRNETILISFNITSDPYNVTKYVNATFDNGTAGTSDDFTLELYDDGTHGDETIGDEKFASTHTISPDATTGNWTINFTVYDEDYIFVDSNSTSFNVTDILNTEAVMLTPKVMVNSQAKAEFTVRNYRNDVNVTGAQVNCSFNGSVVSEIADLGNGTYSMNFTAPAQVGYYNLTCNASKGGNFGNSTDEFEAEPGTTTAQAVPNITELSLENITMFQNQTFQFSATFNNSGNGTAYNSSLYLNVSSGWYFEPENWSCGDVDKHQNCTRQFNVTAPANATPGSYNVSVFAYWNNPDSTNSTNRTDINVTVLQNPLLNVAQEEVRADAREGMEYTVASFTVESIGNFNLTGINFSCISGEVCSNFTVEFIPENITSLANGANQTVWINVTVPIYYPYGSYLGVINVSSGNDGFDSFDLNITIDSQTIMEVVNNISGYTASNVTYYDNETFFFSSNATVTGNSSARHVNMSVELPPNWTSSPELENCTNLTTNQTCTKNFNVTIYKNAAPRIYKVNITANWTNPDSTQGIAKKEINVTVASSPRINVTEDYVNGSVIGGNSTNIGNFTVWSVGNDAATGVNFSCVSGEVCSNFTVNFTPVNISSLANGANQTIAVNVSVPTIYEAGIYSGVIWINSSNGGSDNLTINVTVPAIKAWNITPQNCSHSETGGSGTVCMLNVTNNGNTQIEFNITPSSANYTFMNETSFIIQKRETKTVEVTFDLNGTEETPYNATYFIDAIDADAFPDWTFFRVFLIPTTAPNISVTLVPEEVPSQGYTEIYATVIDKSSTGIAWSRANVTTPNSTNTTLNMNFIGANQWYARYPTIGNATERGIYNITVYASDNIGNIGNLTKVFRVRADLRINTTTLSSSYYQGDTATILYLLTEPNSTGIAGANVSFVIRDPNLNTLYQAFKTTSEDGRIYPLQTFLIPSDAITGTYTMNVTTAFFDNATNQTITENDLKTFEVRTRSISVAGLFVDMETAVVWYPENVLKMSVLVFNGEGTPVDPDDMNITIYDPADDIFLETDLSGMTRNATGWYTDQLVIPSTAASGMYLAIIDVARNELTSRAAKAFRIARGGPYDVRIIPLESEVQQGSILDFNVVVENKGEVTQDVFLHYWITSSASNTSNTTYFEASEAVLTPAHSNQTFTRLASIFSYQPVGLAYLHLVMTYDSIQPSIYANSTFYVIPRNETNYTRPVTTIITPIYNPPTGQFVPTAGNITNIIMNETAPGLFIERYSRDINVARGGTKMETVIIRNVGKTELKNISLMMTGVPSSWYKVSPAKYAYLESGETATFIITFEIPSNADIKPIQAKLYAVSGVLEDAKFVTINVYQTTEEMLRNEIETVKRRLVDFLYNMSIAEREGKDTSSPALLVEDIQKLIAAAEQDLDDGELESCKKKISDASTLLDRAIELLLSAPYRQVETGVPLQYIIIGAVAIALVILVVFLFGRGKKKGIRPYMIGVGRAVERMKAPPKPSVDLSAEYQKLVNVMNALEKEKNEGLINQETYTAMKREFQDRMEKLKKQMNR